MKWEPSCLLEEDINKCPHYDRINHECRDGLKECGMYNKNLLYTKNPYVRQSRWYEKYYKKDDFRK